MPVFNGLTDEYHPTQMLADVLTMSEHCDKPLHQIKYAYRRRRPQQHGQLAAARRRQMGMDVRICGPKSLWPADEHVEDCRELAAQSGARLTITDDPKEAVEGRRLHPHRRLGVDGRAEGGLGRADRAAHAASRSTRS